MFDPNLVQNDLFYQHRGSMYVCRNKLHMAESVYIYRYFSTSSLELISRGAFPTENQATSPEIPSAVRSLHPTAVHL
jgi:hypothetical protein